MMLRHANNPGRNPRSGMTLLEVMVSAVLMSSAFLAIGLAVDTAYSSYRMTEAVSQLDQQAHRALDRIVANISDAGADSVGAPTGINGRDTIAFRRANDYDSEGVAIEWGAETQIGWRMEQGEDDDGIDNDGDGLVDEGEIFWVLDVGEDTERTVTRIRGVSEFLEGEEPNNADDNGNGLVDEAGLDFEWDGTVLTVRLSVAAVGPRGVNITRTVQTAVRLRN